MGTRKVSKLSAFLKDKRLLAGLSQGEVAKKLGYTSPQFVSNWERGLSDPPIRTLRKISTLYDVPLEEMHRVTLDATIQKVTEEIRKKFDGWKK
ncbi:MAG TPA: helix-turn-helix transcriptional regulator [Pseudobdellovibrionaceae bacterium]